MTRIKLIKLIGSGCYECDIKQDIFEASDWCEVTDEELTALRNWIDETKKYGYGYYSTQRPNEAYHIIVEYPASEVISKFIPDAKKFAQELIEKAEVEAKKKAQEKINKANKAIERKRATLAKLQQELGEIPT